MVALLLAIFLATSYPGGYIQQTAFPEMTITMAMKPFNIECQCAPKTPTTPAAPTVKFPQTSLVQASTKASVKSPETKSKKSDKPLEYWWSGITFAFVQIVVYALKKKRKAWFKRWSWVFLCGAAAASSLASQLVGLPQLEALLTTLAVLVPKIVHDAPKDIKNGGKNGADNGAEKEVPDVKGAEK